MLATRHARAARAAAFVLGLALPAGLGAEDAAVDGAWRAEFDTRIGLQKYTFTLKREGDRVTGKAASEVGGEKREVELLEGTLKGDEIAFVETFRIQGNDLRIEYRGKFSADGIAFRRKVGAFATEEFTARRVQPGAAADQPARPDPAPRRRSGAPIVLGTDDKAAFPHAPPGFDARREGIESGKVETVEYESKTVGIRRRMTVYTPPGYRSDRRYPVLYLLHGIGDDERGWVKAGSADAILDNLYAEGKAAPMIVVMPNGRASAEPAPANPFAGNPFQSFAAFEDELLKDVIPAIESRFAAEADRERRALAGLSMGGGQSLNFGLKHLETFAWVGGFSSAPNTAPVSASVADPAPAREKLRLLWVSCGDHDNLMRLSQSFHRDLSRLNVDHIWHVDSGGHEWPVWKNDLYLLCRLLFRERKAPAPAREIEPGAPGRRDTDWLKEAGYGVFMHFLPADARGFGLVEKFDVPKLASQLESVGAKYFVITLGQNSGYFISPNAAYDRRAGYAPGERCSRRDLPMDLSRELQLKGIRLMLYLPAQTPYRDQKSQKAFGLPEGARDQPIDLEFAKRWAEVIAEWSSRYGERVSGWWFDGCYEHVRFNDAIARVYAQAARSGNPRSILAFNPGVRVIHYTSEEDYTAGELNEPLEVVPSSRWLEGSQWHALTYLGSGWSKRNTRYPDQRWAAWVKAVVARGGAVTLDMGPNWDEEAGPIGSLAEAQVSQVLLIRAALDRPPPGTAPRPASGR